MRPGDEAALMYIEPSLGPCIKYMICGHNGWFAVGYGMTMEVARYQALLCQAFQETLCNFRNMLDFPVFVAWGSNRTFAYVKSCLCDYVAGPPRIRPLVIEKEFSVYKRNLRELGYLSCE
jgi:hypothetical protein